MPAVETLEISPFDDDEIAKLFAPLKALPFVAVAVSGGPDSMALMLMLAYWRSMRGADAPEIHVLSVDHGLRRESASEVELVARIARRYGLAHTAFNWDGSKSGGNIPAESRKARYDLMCDWCAQKQISHLLVAHTRDDQAETVLLRLARGSGVDGLSAMSICRWWNSTLIYRPLLEVERSRLLQLLETAHCPYASDPSNLDLKYDRVRFRQALKILEPLGIDMEGLAQTASRLGCAREALDVMTGKAMTEAVEGFDAGYCSVSPQRLEHYPYEIRRRVLARILRAVAGRPYAPTHSSLDDLLTWVMAAEGGSRTLGGCLLVFRQRQIRVMRETGRNDLPEVELHPGKSVLWDNRFRVRLSAAAENPLLVKALGVEKYAGIKSDLELKVPFPSALAASLPSFWHDHELIAVPHLNFHIARRLFQIEAEFANLGQLSEGQGKLKIQDI